MNKDFRISVTIATHCKTKKLMRRLGDRSFYNLIRLWAYIAANKPDGKLIGMNEEDIEIAADWKGQCSEFVLALLELKFMDKVDDIFSIHNWEKHNGYAFHAQQRSEKAQKAATARWKKRNKNGNMVLKDATSNAISNTEQCPSPSPSPSPSLKPKKDMSNSIEYRLTNYLLNFILKRNPNHKKPNMKSWVKSIDLMIRIDKRKPDDIQAVIKWCQNDTPDKQPEGTWKGWANNILSTAKLREKFDKLALKMQETEQQKPEKHKQPLTKKEIDKLNE